MEVLMRVAVERVSWETRRERPGPALASQALWLPLG